MDEKSLSACIFMLFLFSMILMGIGSNEQYNRGYATAVEEVTVPTYEAGFKEGKSLNNCPPSDPIDPEIRLQLKRINLQMNAFFKVGK